MRELQLPRPTATVATIVARDGRFLVVEEKTKGGIRINQPAGHLEAGETLVAAAARETLEETGYFVTPTALVGIYRWQAPESGATFIRFAFAADVTGHDAHRPLDDGILHALWLSYDELAAIKSRHRSPLVMKCVDDYRAGYRRPLDLVTELSMARQLRVVVGMSGGVDSSVAAWLLKQQGFEVVGLFMKNWEDDDTEEYCTSRADLVDAAAVADVIGIDLEAVNFAAEYRERVFAHFLREYQAGRTPNPDVLCNSEIKFRAFLDHARSLGADRIATGHYARVHRGTAGVELMKAQDATKDQSYFLHQLTQEQLAPVLFPLGEIAKREVRAIARREGIPTWAKKDSTGICFIGERPFRDFLGKYLPRAPGPIETPDGGVVGRHHGLAYYTLGQRQGLGVGGTKDGAALPWFVAGKDAGRNALIVVQGHDHAMLYRMAVDAHELHWIAGTRPAATRLALLGAKTRYRMPDAPCRVDLTDDDRCRAVFERPEWAPTPGQYLVLYDGDVCLGGGVISAAAPSAATTSDAVAHALM